MQIKHFYLIRTTSHTTNMKLVDEYVSEVEMSGFENLVAEINLARNMAPTTTNPSQNSTYKHPDKLSEQVTLIVS